MKLAARQMSLEGHILVLILFQFIFDYVQRKRDKGRKKMFSYVSVRERATESANNQIQ